MKAWMASLGMVGLAACGDAADLCGTTDGEHTLDGSYCEGIDISFDSVEVSLFPSSNVVRIVYREGAQLRLEVQVRGDEVVLEEDVSIPLAEVGSLRRGTQGATELLDLTGSLDANSNLVFDTYSGTPGTEVSGRFDTLLNLTTSRTLEGTFSGILVDAEQG